MSQPIRAGKYFSRLGGELHTAGQCLDSIARALLLETDADDDTLRQVLEIHQAIKALDQRLSDAEPCSIRHLPSFFKHPQSPQ